MGSLHLAQAALDYASQFDFARVADVANLTENNMRFFRPEIVAALVALFFGGQTSAMAQDTAAGQQSGKQPAAQSAAKAPAATMPPRPASRGYYPHRPYHRPYRRSGSGSGFGFGSGSGPSWGSGGGPRYYDRGYGPRDWDWDHGGMGFGW